MSLLPTSRWLPAVVLLVASSVAWADAQSTSAPKRALIWLHGNPGGNGSPKIRQLKRALAKDGVQVFAPDLNQVKGGYTVGGALKLVDRLIAAKKLDQVALVGHSFGAKVAAAACARRSTRDKVCGVALHAPALDARTPTIRKPTIVFHGTEDNVVNAEASKRFASQQAKRGSPVQLKLLRDDHALRHNNDLVVDQTASFVRDLWQLGQR